MFRKRGLLFIGAATGAMLVLAGVGVVIWAWYYPTSLADKLGASTTPAHIVDARDTVLHGTIAGLLAAAVGLGLMVRCFIALERDLNRLRAKLGISRR